MFNFRNILNTKCFYLIVNTMQSSTRRVSTSPVIVERVGAITTIGINRPHKRNCVNIETGALLKDAISKFEEDPTSLVGVLYGVGGNFCAGYDLSELASSDKSDDNKILDEAEVADGFMGPTRRFIKKPMIAAVSGYAVAGGFELALMCDLRVVEDTAVMGVYCRRFGVPLLDGGTVRLAALVGLSRALDYILTGRSIEAKEAFQCGLANRIVACGTSLGQAVQLALSLTKFPQRCLLADRESTYNAAYGAAYEKLLKHEYENSAHVISEESIHGAKKFVSGIGKHGKTLNLTEMELPPWEAEDKKQEHTKHKL